MAHRQVTDRDAGRKIPVRVAILLSGGLATHGGIGRVMTYTTRALAADFPEISVFPFRARFAENGPFRHLSVPAALVTFALALIVKRIEVVHINVAPRGSTWRKALFERAARKLGVPSILHLHGSGYDEFYAALTPGRQAAIRAFFGRAAHVVVLSDYWHRFMVEDLGVDAARVSIIPNGVPAADPPVVRSPASVPHFLFLGLVGARKGIDIFLEALADLRRKGLNWTASVAGNGDVEQARAQARSLGLDDAVDFLGWVDEAQADRQLRAADIFVLPSRAENQPVSILEAMARSTPVIATRVGAIPEQVEDGVTALLVDPNDAAALAQAMATLVTDPQRAVAMGEAGLRRFEAQFSARACASRFAALYRMVTA